MARLFRVQQATHGLQRPVRGHSRRLIQQQKAVDIVVPASSSASHQD
jgi:hypothetical protein